jgi:regulator of nucleoside diphosphate kinase
MTRPPISITEHDYERLSLLLSASTPGLSLLEEELARATVIPTRSVQPDVVQMSSTVYFEDVTTNKITCVTLVYPHEANVDEGKISILAPMGTALLGLRAGQSIEWPLPNGTTRRIRVLSVNSEPEQRKAA